MNKSDLEHEYPGIGRLHYFLGQVGMIAAGMFVVFVFGPQSRVMTVMTLVLMIASLILDVMRLRNIGVSQWFVFLRFVPFGKALLGMGLLCAQPGWIETRHLDSAGKSILYVVLALIALAIFIMLWVTMSIPSDYSEFQIFRIPVS